MSRVCLQITQINPSAKTFVVILKTPGPTRLSGRAGMLGTPSLNASLLVSREPS
jgi:hypothetical protein